MTDRKLTPKQKAFVREYLVDLNATQAAIRAGYSEKTAYSIGQENLNKPEIAAAIEKAQGKRAEKTEITAEWVLNSIRDLVATCLTKEEYTVAMKGLELLGKHNGLFPNKVDVTVTDGISAILESARKRAAETQGQVRH